MKFLLVNILILSVLSLALCDDPSNNNDTTSTVAPDSTTTTTTSTITTTTLVTSTTPTTSTITATPTTTTTTTTAPDTTTTTAPPERKPLEFRVPKNTNETACLKVNMTVDFNFTYLAEVDGKQLNTTVLISLLNYTDYTGTCANDSYNTLEISFNKEWTLVFNYTLLSKSSSYELNVINLTYVVDSDQFPNASKSALGRRNALGANLTDFSANKGNAYKCFSQTEIILNDFATIDISNYIAQPFLNGNNQNLDTAIDCPADTTGTSKLVPIIVGSALAVLVVLVLVAYIIGRRKHKPGYQQV